MMLCWRETAKLMYRSVCRLIEEFFYDLFYEQTFMNKFFLTRIEGPRTKDVVNCTDCKAH